MLGAATEVVVWPAYIGVWEENQGVGEGDLGRRAPVATAADARGDPCCVLDVFQ